LNRAGFRRKKYFGKIYQICAVNFQSFKEGRPMQAMNFKLCNLMIISVL
jgi:hypothetical protein